MTKIHLLSSPVPVSLGGDVEAACGRVVRKAGAVIDWEGDGAEDTCVLLLRYLCKKCAAIKLQGRYRYALMTGQSEQDNRRGVG